MQLTELISANGCLPCTGKISTFSLDCGCKCEVWKFKHTTVYHVKSRCGDDHVIPGASKARCGHYISTLSGIDAEAYYCTICSYTAKVQGEITDLEHVEENVPPYQQLATPIRSDITLDMPVKGSMASFFERRVALTPITWTSGTTLNTSIALGDYFVDAQVLEKLNYFARARYTVVVEFETTANSFHAGIIIGGFTHRSTTLSSTVLNKAVNISTMPHGFYKCISDTSPICIEIPFCSEVLYATPSNWDAGIGAGSYYLISAGTLLNSNGVAENVTILPYVYLKDVDIGVPTFTTPAMLEWEGPTVYVETGKTEGEHVAVDVPVDRAATAKTVPNPDDVGSTPSDVLGGVAAASGAIGMAVPPLAWLAEPVAAVAGFGAAVLKMFGFSRYYNPERPTRYIEAENSMMHVDQGETFYKMTFDSAAAVNPGIDINPDSMDMLSFHALGRQWNLHSTFTADVVDTAGTAISTIAVHPDNFILTGSEYTFTGVGLIAFCHNYWAGTMHYRLVVGGAQNQTIILRLIYDPMNSAGGTNHINAFHKILVVKGPQHFDITIPWFSEYVMGECGGTSYRSTGPTASGNGFLRVIVEAPLITPDSATSIPMAMFVKGGDDLVFTGPRLDAFKNLTTYAQMLEWEGPCVQMWSSSSGKQQEWSAVTEASPTEWIVGGAEPSLHKAKDRVGMVSGDMQMSFRPLIHAYHHFRTKVHAPGTTPTSMCYVSQYYPSLIPFRGGDEDTETFEKLFFDTAITAARLTNYGESTLLSILSACFLGYRGSLNWKVHVTEDSGHSRLSHSVLTREFITEDNTDYTEAYTTFTGNTNRQIDINGSGSQVINNEAWNEFSVPYVSHELFKKPFSSFVSVGGDKRLVVKLDNYITTGASTWVMTRSEWYAAGQDFNFICYTGIPIFNTAVELQ